jgi:hypothetical protein
MELLGQAVDRKLGLLVLVAGLLLGCGGQGPNDPPMTPKEEQAMRSQAYSPEQQQAREQRPR